MKQKLQAVLDDDRGVSPVIGVILMVAITVILAAVIGTFVLGLGDSLQQAPQAQLDAEVDSTNNLVISHNGGDSIPRGEIRVTVEDEDDFSPSGDDFTVGGSITLTSASDGELSADIDGDKQVQVIHEPSESVILDTEVTFDNS